MHLEKRWETQAERVFLSSKVFEAITEEEKFSRNFKWSFYFTQII